MPNKIKDVINAIITLLFIFAIGDLIINSERFYFKDTYLYIIVLILLCVGFYNFVKRNLK